MTPALIFTACAVGSLLLAAGLWFEARRNQRAVTRLVVMTGTVRQLETVLVDHRAGTVNSMTLVNVDFSVGGKAYSCRQLYLFAGNRHVGDVGKKFDFPPGAQVGVYYDPQDPRRSALIVDRPRYDAPVIAVGVAVLFGVIAWFTA